jgi:hypothetical protein
MRQDTKCAPAFWFNHFWFNHLRPRIPESLEEMAAARREGAISRRDAPEA